MEEIVQGYSIAGRLDPVAMVRVKTNGNLADIVTRHMQMITRIETTEPLIALRTGSGVGLEGAFWLATK